MSPVRAPFLLGLFLVLPSAPLHSGDAAEGGGLRWYKGNLHTHTLWSDGDDFPEMVADWYKQRGYHFLALSDHNTLQAGEKWVKFGDLKRKQADAALQKYRERFGERVRTRGDLATGTLEVRLATFAEFRGLLEEPGKFLLVQAEEITDKYDKLPVHLNATNVGEVVKPQGGKTPLEVMQNNLRAVREQAARLDRPILAHLNHPNFHYAVPAAALAAAVDEHFFEVYNGHPAVYNEGDATRPGTERIWDIANTVRLAQLNAHPLFGLGTDDSHNYHVVGMNRSGPGRGWVQVRAAELTPAALIRAMEAGDFYASSGVTLRDLRYDPVTKVIHIEIEPDGDATFTTRFIGTPTDFANGADPAAAPFTSPKVGTVFATVEGTQASLRLTGRELYVRAVVTSSKPPVSPAVKEQRAQAWTQPVGWRERAGKSDGGAAERR